ncbi:MAG: ABC transporter substrate-binding protein [Stellaceae bacterium]|jgi:NitT/TauT family transport system substrate-binding protein
MTRPAAIKLAVLLAAAMLIGTPPTRGDEPYKLRIGWVVVPASLEPIYFAKDGIARNNGKSYVLEPIHFAGTTQQMQALATGDLDLANLAYSAIGLAIQNAGLDDLRVIFDGVQDGHDGYYSNEFMVLKDGPVKTVADLKGKVLATNAIGAGVDIGMRAVLRRNHLEDKRDYQVVETQFPNMKQLLLDHKADLIVAVPPFSYDPELRANARTLFTLKDAFGVTQLTAMTAREGFIKQHRAVIVDFMEDAIRAIHWYTDPKNHDEAVKIVSGFMQRPPALFQDWLFTKKDDYRDPNGRPDLAALQRNLNTQRSLGLLNADIDVRKYNDLSMVKEAAARIK